MAKSKPQKEPTLADAFELGKVAARLEYQARERRRRRRPKSFLDWLRRNAIPIGMIASFANSLTFGLWTVYTYYRPAPQAVVEPLEPSERSRKNPQSEFEYRAGQPRSKPEEPFGPTIKLLINSIPQPELSRPARQALDAASYLVQDGVPEPIVNAMIGKYVETLGYITDAETNWHAVWRAWNVLDLVPRVDTPSTPERSVKVATLQPLSRDEKRGKDL